MEISNRKPIYFNLDAIYYEVAFDFSHYFSFIKEWKLFLKNNEIECNFIKNWTPCCIIITRLAAISLEKNGKNFCIYEFYWLLKEVRLLLRKEVIYKTKFPSCKQVFHQLFVHILIYLVDKVQSPKYVYICIYSIIAIL